MRRGISAPFVAAKDLHSKSGSRIDARRIDVGNGAHNRRGANRLNTYTVLLLSSISIASALLLWLRSSSVAPEDGESSWVSWDDRTALTAADAGVTIDVVSISVKPTCVTQRAVAALNTNLGPRHIHIITGVEAQCDIFRQHADNVRCWLEDSFLPGITKNEISKWIEDGFGRGGDEEFSGRRLAGWYLQQFLKMGAAQAIPGLSEHFVIWDPDMILLRPLKLFQPSIASHIDHQRPFKNMHPQRAELRLEDKRELAGQLDNAGRVKSSLRVRVNIGGSHAPGYESAYLNLFGRRLSKAPDGSSFVAHWIVVEQSVVNEFIESICSSSGTHRQSEVQLPLYLTSNGALNGTSNSCWVWGVLQAVRPEHAVQGFSEYASYVSWVHQNKPHKQAIARKRDWLRHPLGGRGVVQALRHLDSRGLCCPSPMHLWLTGLFGYQYTGFEIGHMDGCRYTDPSFQLQYGLNRKFKMLRSL